MKMKTFSLLQKAIIDRKKTPSKPLDIPHFKENV